MKSCLSSIYFTAALFLSAVVSFSAFDVQSVQAGERRIEVGVLRCHIYAGSNYIIGSRKTLRCKLRGKSGKLLGRYRGEIKRLGIDLGQASRTVMSWTVIAPTRGFKRTSLDGDYVGLSADVAVGVGGGAKVLVGGSRDTITLQPLSLQAQRGLNVALAVAGMSLYSQY
ncbi:MAG: DUF992 domain-containing protein [Methyloligellaceae bacterium]